MQHSPDISISSKEQTDRMIDLIGVIKGFKRDYPELPFDLKPFLDIEDTQPGSTLRMGHIQQIKYDGPHPLDTQVSHFTNSRPPIRGRVTWVMKLGRPSVIVGRPPSRHPKYWQIYQLHKSHKSLQDNYGREDNYGDAAQTPWRIGCYQSRPTLRHPLTVADTDGRHHPAGTGGLRIQWVLLDEAFLLRTERLVSMLHQTYTLPSSTEDSPDFSVSTSMVSVSGQTKPDRIRYLVDVIVNFKRDYPELPCDLDGFLNDGPDSTLRMGHLLQIKHAKPHPLDDVVTLRVDRPGGAGGEGGADCVYGRVTWVMKLGRKNANVGGRPSTHPKDWEIDALHKTHGSIRDGPPGRPDNYGPGPFDQSWRIGKFRSRHTRRHPRDDVHGSRHSAGTGNLQIRYVLLDEAFLLGLETFVSGLIVPGLPPHNRIQYDTDPFCHYQEIDSRRLHGRSHPPSHGPRTSTEWDIDRIELFFRSLRDERSANGYP
jgi:hypothetical protein